MKNVYRIDPEGNIHGLWCDELLARMDNKKVRRISEVEFNEDTQKWRVIVLFTGNPLVLGEWSTRKEALSAEVEFLNGKIVAGQLMFDAA